LKQMCADLSLDHAIVKDIVKKAVTQAQGITQSMRLKHTRSVYEEPVVVSGSTGVVSITNQKRGVIAKSLIFYPHCLINIWDMVSISCSRRPVQRVTAGITNGFTAR
jgi:hypothetical protein